MSDNYDVLPLPVHLGNILDKNNNRIKPFVGIYFPVELLNKMGWTKDTRLQMSVEKGFLKIFQTDADQEEFSFDFNELTYVPLEDEP
jgi:hypothetical protein